ncbi:hypothetical protein LTR85_011666 [Meristemomyces frigidus]|nr:hypothetical protein LTR85_011666 [Meristemomyces frigidus]
MPRVAKGIRAHKDLWWNTHTRDALHAQWGGDYQGYLASFNNIHIPASTDQEHSSVSLRPGDTTNFSQPSLTVQSNIQTLSTAPEVPVKASTASGSAEVQVESSDAQPDLVQDDEDESRAVSNEPTNDESPQSTTTTTRTPDTRGDDTPATSNPTLGKITETPDAVTRPIPTDTNQPFSTAQELDNYIDLTIEEYDEMAVTSSAAVVGDDMDTDSPLAKKSRESQDDAGQPHSAERQTTIGASDGPPDTPPEELSTGNTPASRGRKTKKQTYDKQNGRKTKKKGKSAATRRTGTVISHTTTTEDEATAGGSDDEYNPDVGMPMSSDPPDEHRVAAGSAGRSLPPRGSKRAWLPKAGQEDNDDAFPKKRRLNPAAEADAELPKPAFTSRNTRKTAETVEEEDGITVSSKKSSMRARGGVKPSPQVLSANSDLRGTPDSSAISTMSGKVPKVLLSKTTLDRGALAWLKKQGIHVVEDVPTKRSHFVCVVPKGRLATTAKILRSLALGKLVVTEDWLIDSKAQGQLLEPDDYVHDTLKPTITHNRGDLLKGWVVYFTKKLAVDYGTTGWSSIKALANDAGARLVESGSAANGEKTARIGPTIFFGSDGPDDDRTALLAAQTVVYHKEMLTQSILRGEVDLESDEFMFELPKSAAKTKGKKR